MEKFVKFVFEGSSEKTFSLNSSIKWLRDSNWKRPIKVVLNFSAGATLSKTEKQNLYCTVIPALDILVGKVVYER